MRLACSPTDLAVSADLRYSSRDPYAVSVVFAVAGSAPVEWVFARDLLIAGISRPAGIGDVHLFPSDDGVVLVLNSPDGQARLVCDASVLASFAGQTVAVVPLGSEHQHAFIDDELTQLLGGVPMAEPREG